MNEPAARGLMHSVNFCFMIMTLLCYKILFKILLSSAASPVTYFDKQEPNSMGTEFDVLGPGKNMQVRLKSLRSSSITRLYLCISDRRFRLGTREPLMISELI